MGFNAAYTPDVAMPGGMKSLYVLFLSSFC